MAETCTRIQELLSAYLDGRLSPEETARVAGHLELCPECAALLEKMRKLDSIAASAVDDFDDDILDKLEQRIRADIEALPTVNIEQKSKLTRVTPVWYRYVAAAASIMLVFMIGRAVYTSGSLDDWLTFKKGKTVEMGRPPMQGTRPPAPAQLKPAAETPPEQAGRKATNQAVTGQTKPTEAKQKAAPKVGAPAVAPETNVETVTIKEELKHDETVPSEDLRIATQAELKDLSRDKGTARNEYQDMGKVIVAPVEKESQTKGAETGAAVDQASRMKQSDISKSIDVQAMPSGQGKEAESKAAADESRNKETSLEMAPDAASTIEKKSGQLKAQAIQELGKLGYNNALVPAGKVSMVPTTTTLQSRYAAALAEYKPPQGLTSGFAGKRQGVDSTAAVRFVFNRAINMPGSNDLDSQAVKLYLTARAGYDLYRLTSDSAYHNRAVAAREALKGFLDRFVDDPQKAKTAEAYKNELQRFIIQE